MSGSNRHFLPSCSDPERSHFLWNGIWNLKVPHKIKHMIWRATHNALPTLCNLARRNVVKSALCSGCKAVNEDSVHALWSCKSLITIWEPDEVIKKFFKYYFYSFADLWEMFLRMRDRLDLNLVATLFWFIWNRWNSVRVGEVVVEIHKIRQRAMVSLQDYQHLQGPTVHPPTSIGILQFITISKLILMVPRSTTWELLV